MTCAVCGQCGAEWGLRPRQSRLGLGRDLSIRTALPLALAGHRSSCPPRSSMSLVPSHSLGRIDTRHLPLPPAIAGQRGVGVFEVVLIRSLFLVVLTGPELLWRRVNPFGDKT